MKKIKKALHLKTEEYKNKPYSMLKKIIGNVQCFNENSYSFEIHAIEGISGEIKIMVECSRNIFLLNFFAKHRYFKVTVKGDVTDIDGEEFWQSL